MPDEDQSLEARIERLETWARKPGWLDQPAIIDGEPMILLDHMPLGTRIVLGCFGSIMAATFALVVVAGVYYRMTGHPL